MRPDYHKNNEGEQYKKKSKSSANKEKKSHKHKVRDTFRNYVQDFLDKRDDKEYNIEQE